MHHVKKMRGCILKDQNHRKPTEACHKNASSKKKNGMLGSTSTVGAKMTNSSGNLACAASGSAITAPAAAMLACCSSVPWLPRRSLLDGVTKTVCNAEWAAK